MIPTEDLFVQCADYITCFCMFIDFVQYAWYVINMSLKAFKAIDTCIVNPIIYTDNPYLRME